MKTASIAEVGPKLGDYVIESETGPVVLTRDGKPVAVLLAMSDEGEIERFRLAYSPKFQAILERSREQIRQGHGIPAADFWSLVHAEQGSEPTSETP